MDTQDTLTIEIPPEQINPDSLQGTLSPEVSTETPQVQTQAEETELFTEIIKSTDIVTPTSQASPDKPKVGRPCEYCQRKEEVQKIAEAYYKRFKDVRATKPQVPYIQELALELDIDRDIIHDWAEKKTQSGELEHPDFNRTIKNIKTLQELLLLKRTMGRYNPTGAIFQLKTNHKYIETEKQILAGSDNPKEKLEIVFVNEKPLPVEETT